MWQHVKLPEQIRPWDTLACSWDVKQPTNQQTNLCDRFFLIHHRGSHISSSWMVHAGRVFVAGIHPSRIWISGSPESVRWNACVHRLDLGLYSHPKEFRGNGIRTHVNSEGKIPSGSFEEDRIDDTASRRTANSTHYRLSYPGPLLNNEIVLTVLISPEWSRTEMMAGWQGARGVGTYLGTFLKLVARGFLRVLRFPPLLHRFNSSANKINLK